MKPATPIEGFEEIELKLALPAANPSILLKSLSQTPVLARRQPTQQQLHNVYYDTPEQHLRQQRVALRIRRVGSEAKPQWLQTFKTGGRGDSALSQRGEWETPVPNATLSFKALKVTPWSDIDPDGSLFRTLTPSFVTSFERTSWQVRRRDGSVVEVALDLGQIVAGDKTSPICELELELKAGQPSAVFDVAQQIARTIAVLPATMSKAERGYALAQNCLDAPLRAQPPPLASDLTVLAAARHVLSEMFCQFTTNLNTLCTTDDPEVVHQARVGWRRFKSASRLFRSVLAPYAVPSWQAMQVLLTCLGDLRELDVARTETLSPLAEAYKADNELRARAWQAMTQALTQGADLQRQSVRDALREPGLGACLLATTQWLADLPASPSATDGAATKVSLQRWSRRRIDRLHAQFKRALKEADDPESQHRARILAKRMRYGIEALRSLLPRKRAQRWGRQATDLQTSIGTTRDLMQAATLVARLELDLGLAEFLRGVAEGSGVMKRSLT